MVCTCSEIKRPSVDEPSRSSISATVATRIGLLRSSGARRLPIRCSTALAVTWATFASEPTECSGGGGEHASNPVRTNGAKNRKCFFIAISV